MSARLLNPLIVKRGVVGVVVIGLALSLGWSLGWSLGCESGKNEIVQDRPNHLPAVGTTVGDEVREINEKDLDGVRFELSEFRGKVVLLSFWASW